MIIAKFKKQDEGRKIDDFMKYIEMYLIIKNYRHYIRLICENNGINEDKTKQLIHDIEEGYYNPDSL